MVKKRNILYFWHSLDIDTHFLLLSTITQFVNENIGIRRNENLVIHFLVESEPIFLNFGRKRFKVDLVLRST